MSPVSRSRSTAATLRRFSRPARANSRGTDWQSVPPTHSLHFGFGNDPANDLEFELLTERKLEGERLDRHEELEAGR